MPAARISNAWTAAIPKPASSSPGTTTEGSKPEILLAGALRDSRVVGIRQTRSRASIFINVPWDDAGFLLGVGKWRAMVDWDIVVEVEVTFLGLGAMLCM
jgi:hypothetical protein